MSSSARLSSLVCRYTVLFSHGNAVDLGQMSSFYIGLGTRINCNIFSYDYSGYGVSTGKPSEKNLYADIDAAWHALRTRYSFMERTWVLTFLSSLIVCIHWDYDWASDSVGHVDECLKYEVYVCWYWLLPVHLGTLHTLNWRQSHQ